MSKLSENESLAIHFYNQKYLLENLRVRDLPLSVQSAALLFYKKFFNEMCIDDYEPRLVLLAIVLLACKSENIHGSFREIIGNCTNEEKSLIFQYESLIATSLHFDFHIPSPYLRMVGFIVLLQEKGRIIVENGQIDPKKNIRDDGTVWDNDDFCAVEDEEFKFPYVVKDINEIWKHSILYLDKIFYSHDIDKTKINTFALAALRLPVYVFDGVFEEINTSDVIEIRRDTKTYRIPDEQQIISAFRSLRNVRNS